MSEIGAVIGWKFDHQAGMSTKNGVITKFPGGIPTQADQDIWTAEYLARDIEAERVEQSFTLSDQDQIIFKMLFELTNRVLVLEGSVVITPAQFKIFLKGKL